MSQRNKINIKNRTYYFFSILLILTFFYLNQIKMDKNSYKNIVIYYIGYITIKYLSFVNISSVNRLYLIIYNTDGEIEENNGNENLIYFLLLNTKIH